MRPPVSGRASVVRRPYSVTTNAFVWARAIVPSPRTFAGPGAAPAGMVTSTLALPVLDVRGDKDLDPDPVDEPADADALVPGEAAQGDLDLIARAGATGDDLDPGDDLVGRCSIDALGGGADLVHPLRLGRHGEPDRGSSTRRGGCRCNDDPRERDVCGSVCGETSDLQTNLGVDGAASGAHRQPGRSGRAVRDRGRRDWRNRGVLTGVLVGPVGAVVAVAATGAVGATVGAVVTVAVGGIVAVGTRST